jgi:hypothetical protein
MGAEKLRILEELQVSGQTLMLERASNMRQRLVLITL